MRQGLSRDSRRCGVLLFAAITVESALQMGTPSQLAAKKTKPNPAREDTGAILVAPVTTTVSDPMRHGHDQALDTRNGHTSGHA